MLNTAKTKGKKTRENTSIFLAWNSKFLNHMRSLLDFLTGSLGWLDVNILTLKYLNSPVMNNSTRRHYLWTFDSSHKGILQQQLSDEFFSISISGGSLASWHVPDIFRTWLGQNFVNLLTSGADRWFMGSGLLRVTLWLNVFFPSTLLYYYINNFVFRMLI